MSCGPTARRLLASSLGHQPFVVSAPQSRSHCGRLLYHRHFSYRQISPLGRAKRVKGQPLYCCRTGVCLCALLPIVNPFSTAVSSVWGTSTNAFYKSEWFETPKLDNNSSLNRVTTCNPVVGLGERTTIKRERGKKIDTKQTETFAIPKNDRRPVSHQ